MLSYLRHFAKANWLDQTRKPIYSVMVGELPSPRTNKVCPYPKVAIVNQILP